MALTLTPEQKAAIDEQKQYCPFCKIVKGEIPVQKIYEDSNVIVVLDINPGVPGHAIIVPKEHYPVLPFVPDNVQDALARLYPDLSAAMGKALFTKGAELFIANGAAAGQQTSHFLIHLFPNDQSLFTIPATENSKAGAMRAAVQAKYADRKERLSTVLSANPELRRMLIEQPREFRKQLASAPDVARLFADVDIEALALKLAEQEPPRAAHTEDEQLVTYLNHKEKLANLLLSDPETLETALETQPKIKVFFEGTTVAAVRERYTRLRATTNTDTESGGKQ
jgi:histidine triad (HIT) family protein